MQEQTDITITVIKGALLQGFLIGYKTVSVMTHINNQDYQWKNWLFLYSYSCLPVAFLGLKKAVETLPLLSTGAARINKKKESLL